MVASGLSCWVSHCEIHCSLRHAFSNLPLAGKAPVFLREGFVERGVLVNSPLGSDCSTAQENHTVGGSCNERKNWEAHGEGESLDNGESVVVKSSDAAIFRP